MKQKNNCLNFAIIGISALLLLWYVFRGQNPQNLLLALETAQLGWLFAGGLCMLAYWGMESLSLYLATRQLSPKVPFESSVKTAMIGQLFNCITPFASGGQPVQAYHMVRCGIPLGSASSALLAKFVIYQVVLTFYSIVMLVFRFPLFAGQVSGFRMLVLVGFAVNTAVVVGLISIGFFPNFTRRFCRAVVTLLAKTPLIKAPDQLNVRIDREIGGFYRGFQLLMQHPLVLLQISVYTTLQLTAFFLIPYCLCLAFGLSASPFSIIAAGAFVMMITSFVPLPGAAGGAEGSFLLFFRMFFGPGHLLGLAVLLWRLLTYYLPILVGMLFAGDLSGAKLQKS